MHASSFPTLLLVQLAQSQTSMFPQDAQADLSLSCTATAISCLPDLRSQLHLLLLRTCTVLPLLNFVLDALLCCAVLCCGIIIM